MSKHAYTPGPWRWEINMQSKVLHLVGGRPRFDLTIMDFARWGMGDAVATLRDPAVDGMNIMHRLCDRKDWIAPFPGRGHHASWCSDVTHPDMRLIAAAPDLAEALAALADWHEWSLEQSERAADDFYRETGMMAPYKDVAAAAGGDERLARQVAWKEWYSSRNAALIESARDALKRAGVE